MNRGDLRHHYEKFLMGVERLHGDPAEDQAACQTGADAGENACEDGFADQAAVIQQEWDALRRGGPGAWAAAQPWFRRTVGAAPEGALEHPRWQDEIPSVLECLMARSDALSTAGEDLQARCARCIGDGAAGEVKGPGGGARGVAGDGVVQRDLHSAARKRELVPLFKLGANLFCVGDCVSVNGSDSDTPFIAQLLSFDRQTQLVTVRWLYRADEVNEQVRMRKESGGGWGLGRVGVGGSEGFGGIWGEVGGE